MFVADQCQQCDSAKNSALIEGTYIASPMKSRGYSRNMAEEGSADAGVASGPVQTRRVVRATVMLGEIEMGNSLHTWATG